MIILAALLALAAPSRAQTAPAPADAIQPENVDELFHRFASGRPMIPTLKEVQALQLKRDLAAFKGEGGSPTTSLGLFNQAPMQGVRRETTESVDVSVSRPARRVELGAGFSETDVNVGNRHVLGGQAAYGFVAIDLAKVPLARKRLHSPTAVHSAIETQDDRVRVTKDEYTTEFLKHPN